MTPNHLIMPQVVKTKVESVDVWQLIGDWEREVPSDVRHTTGKALKGTIDEGLVLNLSDIGFTDTWGVEIICDLVHRVYNDGRTVALYDCGSGDTHHYTTNGILQTLDCRDLTIKVHADFTSAVSAVRCTS